MARWPVVVVPVLIAFSLACGGVSRGAGKDSLEEAAATLATVENSPEKAQVRALIEEAYVQVHRGELGLFAVSGFKVALQDACEDGRIGLAELSALQAEATWMARPAVLDPAERAALLAGLSPYAEVALARSGLSSWSTSDLSARITAAGWTVDSCDRYADYGYTETTCAARKGRQYATVTLTEHPDAESARWAYDVDEAVWHDFRHVLAVYVMDEAVAKQVGDLAIPPSGPIPVDASYYERVLTPAGWTQTDLYVSRDASGDTVSFTVVQGDVRASVMAYLYKSGPSLTGDTYSLSGGSLSVNRGRTSLSVTADDRAAAKRLVSALQRG